MRHGIGLRAAGVFGSQVKELLSTMAANAIASDGPDLIIAMDAFDPAAIGSIQAGTGPSRLLLCFLTVRGLFISPWLSPAGPCATCLERRWFANLAFWEHSPEQERALQALEEYRPGIRSFPVPASAVHLAARLVMSRLDAPDPEPFCDYVDLVSCATGRGLLLRIDGCAICAPKAADPRRRYLHGLAELAGRLQP